MYNYTYRQNPSKYRDYLLGIEWAVYFGKKIANKVIFNLFPENEVVERLENGVLMMAKCDLLEYDDSYRRELMPVLNEYLLPCCGYYELNQLRNMKPVFCTPKTVAIIKDVYLPQQICPPVVWISSKDDFAFGDLQILNDSDETYVFYGGFEKLIKMFED